MLKNFVSDTLKKMRLIKTTAQFCTCEMTKKFTSTVNMVLHLGKDLKISFRSGCRRGAACEHEVVEGGYLVRSGLWRVVNHVARNVCSGSVLHVPTGLSSARCGVLHFPDVIYGSTWAWGSSKLALCSNFFPDMLFHWNTVFSKKATDCF